MNNAQEWLLALLLLAPGVGLSVWLRRSASARAQFPAVALGIAWQLQARLAVAGLAHELDLWRFAARDAAWYGVPLEWLLGTTALSAGVLTLGLARWPLSRALPALAVAETLCALVLASCVLVLGDHWPLVVAALVAAAIVPAELLVRDTLAKRRLWRRAWLASLCFAGLLGFVLPDIALRASGQSWEVLLNRPVFDTALLALPLLLPVLLYSLAAREFARVGNGTAYPFDPPTRLVTTGVYAVVANPMQIAICLFLLLWGPVVASPVVSLAALGALMQYIVFKRLCSGRSTLGETLEWHRYKARVRSWIPRLSGREAETPPPVESTPCDARPNARRVRGITLFASLDHWVAEHEPAQDACRAIGAPHQEQHHEHLDSI